jgi:RNA polymerase sigma-70 factor, ECF subfamily
VSFHEPATTVFPCKSQAPPFGSQPHGAALFADQPPRAPDPSPLRGIARGADRPSHSPASAEAADGAALTAEAVFHQYARRIYNLARRMLTSDADVKDVTQDVLVQVVRKLGTFRGESDLATWLHRVTVNAALVHRRKRAPQLARQAGTSVQHLEENGRPGGLSAPWGAGPDGQLIGRETRELIERAVRGLPEKYRDPFVLSDIEGLSNAEIGGLLGLSLPAVKSRLHRARLLLRDSLKPHFEVGEPLVVLESPATV